MRVEFLRKYSPWSHAKFQTWCVSAVVGDLSPERLTELEKHIRKCEKCRTFLENTAQSNLEAMPAFWDKRKAMISVLPPEGMRARFLQRLNRQRTGPEETFPLVELELSVGARPIAGGSAHIKSDSQPTGFWVFLRPVPVAAFLIAASLFVSGYYTGSRSKAKASATGKTLDAAPLENANSSTGIDGSLEIKEKLLQSVLADSAKEQALAKVQRQVLEERLATSEARLISLVKENASAFEQSRESERGAQEALAVSRRENEALRKKITDQDSMLAAEERRAQELRNELQITRGSLEEQEEQRVTQDQQATKGQLGDLVTARNLHIVDVYDADGGRRKPSFGRVFYVEGKSLLFYAYDLQDAKQAKANIVFHVWGGRVGAKEVTHSLGILHNEDPSQGLWTMTFDDSSVLAQINSVFVTAEPANQRGLVPRGKRVLYAYLGSPANHP